MALDPKLLMLYKYFLCTGKLTDIESTVLLVFMLEGSGRSVMKDFLLKHARSDTELYIAAENCKIHKNGNSFINWNRVEDALNEI